MQGVCLAAIVKAVFPHQKQEFYSSHSGYNYLISHGYDAKKISTRDPQPSILGALGNQTIYSLMETIIQTPPSAVVIDGELSLIPVIRGIYKGVLITLCNKFDLFNFHHPTGVRGVFLSHYSHCDHIIIGALGDHFATMKLPSKFPRITWAMPFVRPEFLTWEKEVVATNSVACRIAVVLGGGHSGASALKAVNEEVIRAIVELAAVKTDTIFSLFGIEASEFQAIGGNIRIGLAQECPGEILRSTMVIARAGRNALSEVLALKKPAILITPKNEGSQTDKYRFVEQFDNICFAAKISSGIRVWDGKSVENLFEFVEQLLIPHDACYTWEPGNRQFASNLSQLRMLA